MCCRETRHGYIGKEGCYSCLGTGHPLASGGAARGFIGREPARTSIDMSATGTIMNPTSYHCLLCKIKQRPLLNRLECPVQLA
jgi:hypothetical protein